MISRPVKTFLILIGSVVFAALIVVPFLPVGEGVAQKKYWAYSLKQESESVSCLARSQTAIDRFLNEDDTFLRAVEAVDLLSLLQECVAEHPAFPLETVIEPLGVHSLAELESEIIIPLKKAAGSGADPLVDATFSWVAEGYPYGYWEIAELHISRGRPDLVRVILNKAFQRVGMIDHCGHDPEGARLLSGLVETSIDLGETNLAYRFMPNLLVSEMQGVGSSLSDTVIPVELAGIYRKLGRNGEAKHYYDLAYGFLLRETAEREASALRSSFLETMFRPMSRMDAFWHKSGSVSIAQRYIEFGETNRAEQVLAFISDHVVTDAERYSFSGLYDMPKIAGIYAALGKCGQADALLKSEIEHLFKSKISNLEALVLAEIIRWYAEQGKEIEAQRIVEQTQLAIPLSDGFSRGQFTEELIERDLVRFVPIVLAPMVDHVSHGDYSEEKYRLNGLLRIADLYNEAGFETDANALLGAIESIALAIEDKEVKIRAINQPPCGGIYLSTRFPAPPFPALIGLRLQVPLSDRIHLHHLSASYGAPDLCLTRKKIVPKSLHKFWRSQR